MVQAIENEPVEARSLLPLITLASNPPAYPRNPTQKALEPLVLYIVRVPGSKDIFLSPLKPPTKSSLSPESLNASLYFLHVAGPGDDAILETIERERQLTEQNNKPVRRTSKFALLNNFRRKPLPGSEVQGNGDADDQTQAQPEEIPPPLPQRPQAAGTTLDEMLDSLEMEMVADSPSWAVASDSKVESRRPSLPPRPLPPLPPDAVLDTPALRPSPKTNNRWSIQPPASPDMLESTQLTRGIAGRASLDSSRPMPNSKSKPSRFLQPPGSTRPDVPLPLRPRRSYDSPRGVQQQAQAPPFHITLIRRDPTHGNQWNVGTIENTGDSASGASPDGTITIEITTPGYKKFAIDNTHHLTSYLSSSLPHNSMPSLQSLALLSQSKPADTPSDPKQPTGPVKFIRKLTLSNSHQNHKLTISPSHENLLTPPRPNRYPHRSTGHYSFASPWNGHCTFITGANGRSLKCKHTIPSPGAIAASQSSPASVAEIRFNLPTLLPANSNGNLAEEVEKQRQKALAMAGRLDLSLARERAGGGLRGNSAKLGKLIIEDEGLKMLDLMVASCMAVFWKYYDHT
ncbi:hypothetical protein FQN57_000411 [Myotisia sp. PD_48]|nr:hypothetical protein FQN57_000411 [Myotisia sp. PD_48]